MLIIVDLYCPKPFPTTHIKISYGTLYVIDKTDVIDQNANVNATESRNQYTSAEVEILTKNDLIRNQEPNAQHIVEDDTKCNVTEEENRESTNKDKDTIEKVSHVPHFIEEKQTYSLLPNLDTKGDQLCFSCVFRLISRKN